MSSDIQHDVALELGFPQKLVKYALRKKRFRSAGSFVDYLETHTEELEAALAEEEKEEPVPGEEKIVIVPWPSEDKPSTDAATVAAASTNTSTRAKSTLREETEALYRQSVCLRCFLRRRSCITFPCGHFTLCSVCQPLTRLCPERDCPMEILSYINVFY